MKVKVQYSPMMAIGTAVLAALSIETRIYWAAASFAVVSIMYLIDYAQGK